MMMLEGNEQYVEGALRLLQFVEARRPTGRRFGADADARWNSFRGDLETIDRIELMIRDADAEWRGGFGARTVYRLQGVAEDEPFGSQWKSLDPVLAEELWRRVKDLPPPPKVWDVLDAIASAWDIKLKKQKLEPIAPTDHLVVVGASAVASTIDTFSSGTALDWPEQVVIVASTPGVRQLAAAGAAILNATQTAPIISHDDPPLKIKKGARLVSSSDADSKDRAAAEKLMEG